MALSDPTLDDESEGYFASVSDLMVGILFVFLLMLTVFALNFRDAEDEQMVKKKEYEELYKKLIEQTEKAEAATRQAELDRKEADHQKELAFEARAEADRRAKEAEEQRVENQNLRDLLRAALERLERDMEERQSLRARLLASLEAKLKDRNVAVNVDPNSGILRFSGDVLFAKDKSILEGDARQTVATIGDVLLQVLPCYATGAPRAECDPDAKPILEAVLVEGHTDRQPYRGASQVQSEELNDRLSADRALSVFKELRQGQRGLDNLRNGDDLPLFGVSGYGQRRPRGDALGGSQADFERNRRIDLRFVLSARTSAELNRLREQINEVLKRK